MLSPKYLTDCSYEIEVLFAQLEMDILSDIARRIAENDYSMTSTAQFQLNREKALGMQYDEMQKQIAALLDVTEKKVAEIIPESSYKSVEKDNIVFKHAYDKGITSKFNYNKEDLKKIILEGIGSTNGEIRNICKTTAKSARKFFSNQLDATYLAIQSGAISQQEAIANAARTIGKQGLQWIDYKSGAHRRVDTAIRNAVRTGVNQTACRCQDKNFDEMGGNLVITSSHMGARPSHAEWQGQIFWRKKKYKNYRNFEQATKYGSGDGLGGWGCRHGFYPYFEGLSNKAFEHYNEDENEDRYILDQTQRYHERMIREWKRRDAVNLSAGVNNTKEARKVREWQQRQKDFLKENPELKRNYARESIVKNKASAKGNKLKEFYAMDNENVRMKIRNSEDSITNKKTEHAIIYDKDGGILLKKKGDEHSIEFSLKELQSMKNAIVTHNHPNNVTFSPDDIYMLINWNLQELRATVFKGVYVLRRNENVHLMPTNDSFMAEHAVLYGKYRKVYKNKYPNWKDDVERMDRVVQNNIMNYLAKKYGLNYGFEEK